MKKIVAFTIALCLVVLACVPAIPVFAFNGTDIKVHNRDSVSQAFETQELNNIAKNIYNFVPSSTNWVNVSKVYEKISILPSAALNYLNYVLVYRNGKLELLCFDGDLSTIFVNAGAISYKDTVYSANDKSTGLGYINIPVVNGGYSYMIYECSWTDSSQWSGQGYTSSSNGNYYNLYYGGSILSTNIPLYFFEELNMKSIQHSGINSQNLYTSPELYNQLTDFASANLPYVGEDGTIVVPSTDPELNTALAFDTFNSQVVYNQFNKTFTSANISWDLNPMGRTILESYPATEWNMKFICQVSYNMSSYRMYNQYTPIDSYANGFTFTGFVNFEDYDSIMDGQIYGLDPIKGFETLSDAEIASAVNADCNLFFALLGSMQGNYASGNDFTSGKSGFALLGGQIKRNWERLRTEVNGFLGGLLQVQNYTGIDPYEYFENTLSGDYIYMLDNFTMNVQAWFECGSVKSQSGYTDIDFVNHTTSSYAPRAYETQEGVEPTIPDPYTNTNDVPVEPGGLDANGVVVYVPVNVEVNVPSGGGDNTVTSGDNSIINNNNPTFNPVFNNNNENSVESLSDLIGEDAATANNGIGGFLDPFKNNAMVTLTGEYLGIIPDQLKTLLTAAVGILIILGIYRFIRRG